MQRQTSRDENKSLCMLKRGGGGGGGATFDFGDAGPAYFLCQY